MATQVYTTEQVAVSRFGQVRQAQKVTEKPIGAVERDLKGVSGIIVGSPTRNGRRRIAMLVGDMVFPVGWCGVGARGLNFSISMDNTVKTNQEWEGIIENMAFAAGLCKEKGNTEAAENCEHFAHMLKCTEGLELQLTTPLVASRQPRARRFAHVTSADPSMDILPSLWDAAVQAYNLVIGHEAGDNKSASEPASTSNGDDFSKE